MNAVQTLLALDLRRWLAAEDHLTYGRSVSE